MFLAELSSYYALLITLLSALLSPPPFFRPKQVSSSVQQSGVEITEILFEKTVPIHFVNYYTTNNILWT